MSNTEMTNLAEGKPKGAVRKRQAKAAPAKSPSINEVKNTDLQDAQNENNNNNLQFEQKLKLQSKTIKSKSALFGNGAERQHQTETESQNQNQSINNKQKYNSQRLSNPGPSDLSEAERRLNMAIPQQFATRIMWAVMLIPLVCMSFTGYNYDVLWDFFWVATGVFCLSVNYWRFPTFGWRRNLDMAWAFLAMVYHTWLSYWVYVYLADKLQRLTELKGNDDLDQDNEIDLGLGLSSQTSSNSKTNYKQEIDEVNEILKCVYGYWACLAQVLFVYPYETSYGFGGGDFDASSMLHCMLHLVGNIGNLCLYIAAHEARVDLGAEQGSSKLNVEMQGQGGYQSFLGIGGGLTHSNNIESVKQFISYHMNLLNG